jgi:hypothetical protein
MAGRYTNGFAIEKRNGALCPYTEDQNWVVGASHLQAATRKSLTRHCESRAKPLRHFSNSFASIG